MPGLGVEVKGKIAVSESAQPGRAVARFTDLGFGPRVRAALAEGQADAELPDDLLDATVRVLSAWDWKERPAAVVQVGSLRRPRLISSLATRICTIGRLPHLGEVIHRGRSSTGRSNSAQRLKAVWDAYDLPDELVTVLSGAQRGRPVLLVDDFSDTGWTLTVVTRLLRRAGAGEVYPLVLGIRS
jgi:ATP-dependent DNA helicase RecQ